jgi:5-methylcytosine-specific restriction endonuclease McrA
MKNQEDTVREKRAKIDEEIVVKRNYRINWDHFKFLVDEIPQNLDKTQKKQPFQPKDRLNFEERDQGECFICGSTFPYGSCNVYLYTGTNYKLSHLHHRIPNGTIQYENIYTLCTHCHQMVHQALFIAGKWKYGRPL